MRILRLPAYFYPEKMASTHLQIDRMEGFAKAGHEIIVYAPYPCRGIDNITRKKYSKKIELLYDGKIEIHRFPLFKERKNVLLRIFRYILCLLIQYILGSCAHNIDVIYSSSTPPIQGIMCGAVKKRLEKKYKKKIPIIYNLQDIFPDSLVAAGLTKKESFLWKIGRMIEDKTYQYADKIIVINESFKKNIMEKGVQEEKIVIISNWVDIEKIHPVSKNENTLFEELSIPKDKFIVLYAGNFGIAQGADIIIKAAEKMKNEHDIYFVIFGGGSEFEKAKLLANNFKLKNIIFSPLLSQDRISEVYSLGDVALITCKPGFGKSAMPSKVWSIMACNTPIIASFDMDSELASIIRESEAGKCVEAGNENVLVESIQYLYYLNVFGDVNYLNFRNYVEKVVSKDLCVGKYIETFQQVGGSVEV